MAGEGDESVVLLAAGTYHADEACAVGIYLASVLSITTGTHEVICKFDNLKMVEFSEYSEYSDYSEYSEHEHS